MTELPVDTKKLLEQLKRILNSEPWTVRDRLGAYIELIEGAMSVQVVKEVSENRFLAQQNSALSPLVYGVNLPTNKES